MAKRTDFPDNISANAKKLCAESEKSDIKNNISEVIALLEEAYKDSPESRSVLIKLSDAYLESGSPGKAVRLLEGASFSDDDTELQQCLADAYAERKWGKKAIAQYKKCLSSDYIYPELIQDFSEFMLDSGEHRVLLGTVSELLEKRSSAPADDVAAMCIAMIYSAIGDCAANNIKSDTGADFMKNYLEKNPEASDKAFFTNIIRYLSGTPNDRSITKITDQLFRTMADSIPSVTSDNDFQHAAADFEISLILYSNDVNPLTIFAMRTAKLRFASASDDRDTLRYLVFDAKMTIVDILRNNSISTSSFRNTYPFLWSLISGFVTGAEKTPDLKKFARDEIYSELKNASPDLMKILESNLAPDGFAALKKFISSSDSAPGPAVYSGNKTVRKTAVSSKTAPNAPCPCGSGKKYKKCCGLK